jgi:vacuolar protein sorting-associated protein 13A/C
LRPPAPLSPISRFRFAANCFLRDIHARNKTYEWRSVLLLREDRKAYIEGFKLKELGQASLEDLAKVELLERSLGYDHLRWFRAIARRELYAEQLKRSYSKSSEPAQPAGWFGWFWAGGRQLEEEELEIQEDEIKALYEAIDYNDSLQSETSLPPTAKLFGINFELGSGSVSVSQDKPLMQLQFFALFASILKRPKSLRCEVELVDLSLIESLVTDSLMPTLLRAKSPSTKDADEEPVFSVVFDQLPVNPDAEYEVRLKMRPLEVCVSHQAFALLQNFFVKGDNKEAFSSFSAATQSQLQELASKTRIGLEQAITRHKAVDWFVDVEAPIVTIPLDCCDKDLFLFVLDLGRLSVRSQLVTKRQRIELKAKLTEDLTRINIGLYDRLDIQLNQAKVRY